MHSLATVNNAHSALAAISTAVAPHPTLGSHDIQVLIVAAVGIAIVLLLIVLLKVHAFLALTFGALFVGIGSGIPLDKVTASYENGAGGVLGYVGVLLQCARGRCFPQGVRAHVLAADPYLLHVEHHHIGIDAASCERSGRLPGLGRANAAKERPLGFLAMAAGL